MSEELAFFNIACSQAFQFLLTEGFTMEIPNLTGVGSNIVNSRATFSNDKKKIEVLFSRLTNEIETTIDIYGTKYGVSEFGMAAKQTDPLNWRNFCASDQSELQKGLELEAIRTRNALILLSKFQASIIEKVKRQRIELAEEMEELSLTNNIRPAAYDAFRRRDYHGAVDQFARMKNYLNKTDLAKLKFALRKTRNASS